MFKNVVFEKHRSKYTINGDLKYSWKFSNIDYIVYCLRVFTGIHAHVHVYIKGFCLQNSTVPKVFKKWRFFMHYFPLATHIFEAVDKLPALVVNSWIRTGDMVTLAMVQPHRFLTLLTHQLRANQIHQVKHKRLVYLSLELHFLSSDHRD